MGPKPHPSNCVDADKCRPSPGGGHRRLVHALVIAASVLVFLSIVSLIIYCLVRRLRRRRQEHLLAADPAPSVEGDAAASDVEGGAAAPDVVEWGAAPEEDDEVAHHAWQIRTVGLDEAAIESIALTRYRAGAGTLGAADCSVCLGEFQEGELLRLLPACSHAFHVPCIDTWLRAHVNCPLCRADVVLDPAAAADTPGANADTDAEQASISIEAMDNELGSGRQQNESQDLRVQIGQRDLSTSPEALHRQIGLRVQDFRRAASMNFRRAVSADEAPVHDTNSKENQGNGGAACWKVASTSGRLYHMKRSLSGGGLWSRASRHSRTRSSILPS